jgi:hypothetical protein
MSMTKKEANDVIQAALDGTLEVSSSFDFTEKVNMAERVLLLHALHGNGRDPALNVLNGYAKNEEAAEAQREDAHAHAALMRALATSHYDTVEQHRRVADGLGQIASALRDLAHRS